jgi:hypothetical protein
MGRPGEFLVVSSANHRSTRFNHDPEVGAKSEGGGGKFLKTQNTTVTNNNIHTRETVSDSTVTARAPP